MAVQKNTCCIILQFKIWTFFTFHSESILVKSFPNGSKGMIRMIKARFSLLKSTLPGGSRLLSVPPDRSGCVWEDSLYLPSALLYRTQYHRHPMHRHLIGPAGYPEKSAFLFRMWWQSKWDILPQNNIQYCFHILRIFHCFIE